MLGLVKKYDIPREMLRVEITETILTEDPVKIKKAIDRFYANGFQVLMDDFGSGASSLNTLKEYGFDEIKLDMIFMRKFDDRSKKVIKPLISMAKSLGVHTLCEGVESKEQIAFLKDVGCEVVQGYYYGKPNTFAEVKWLTGWKTWALNGKGWMKAPTLKPPVWLMSMLTSRWRLLTMTGNLLTLRHISSIPPSAPLPHKLGLS